MNKKKILILGITAIICVGNLFADNVKEIMTCVKKGKADSAILKKVDKLSPAEQQELISKFNDCKDVDQQIRMLPLISKLPFEKFKPVTEEYIINKKDCPDELYWAMWKELGTLLMASDKGIKSENYKFLKELQAKFMKKKYRTLSQTRHFGSLQGFLEDTYPESVEKAKQDPDIRKELHADMEAYVGNDYKKLFILTHYQKIDFSQPHVVMARAISPAPYYMNRKYLIMLTELLSHENNGVRMSAAEQLRVITKEDFKFNPANSPKQEEEKIEKWKECVKTFRIPK